MNRDEAVESMQKSLFWGNWEPQNADAIRTMILEMKRIELLEKENAALRRKLGQPCPRCRNHKANEAFLLWDDIGRGYMVSNLSNCPYCGRFLTENVLTEAAGLSESENSPKTDIMEEVRKQDYANLQKQAGDLCTAISKYAEQYDTIVEIHTQTDQKTEISVTDEYFEKKRIQNHYDEKFLGKKVKIKQDGTIHEIVKVVVFDEDTFGQGTFAVTTDDNRYLYEREFDVLD